MKRPALAVGLGIALVVVIGAIGVSYIPGYLQKGIANQGHKATPPNDEVPDDASTYTVDRTDYSVPRDDDDVLKDDRIEDKVTSFDPSLVDRRSEKGWQINGSEAVIRLDVPIIKPDVEPELLVLHPSYKAAIKDRAVLPSVNLIDGKAKQFDDGLYAALDQAYFLGEGEAMKGHVDLVKRIFDRVDKDGAAAAYLAAGLELAGVKVQVGAPEAVKSRVAAFLNAEVSSKPIGFYTWTPELSRCFRFLRYFSLPIERPVVAELVSALNQDPSIKADARKAVAFYAKFTNPPASLSLPEVADHPEKLPPENVAISLFPPSTSRENELFAKLFPLGLPPDANLMREIILAIRSGKVDLTPRPESGWYDYQVYALETLLLPEKGEESNKLLLTKVYKKRMLEAFKALMTKRRETHSRTLPAPTSEPSAYHPPLQHVSPRLRVEPSPSYYLRTARSYAFLANFLELTVGAPDAQENSWASRRGTARARSLHRIAFHARPLLRAVLPQLRGHRAQAEPGRKRARR